MLFCYMLFCLTLFFAACFFLVRAIARAFRRRGKKAGFFWLALTLGFLYAVFHYMTFENQQIFPLLTWDAEWSYRIRNDSSVENPKVFFEFKKLYVRYKIDLDDWGKKTDSDERCIYGGFYTKNIGYEFSRAIVPRGIKAELVHNFDYDLEIVLKDDNERSSGKD